MAIYNFLFEGLMQNGEWVELYQDELNDIDMEDFAGVDIITVEEVAVRLRQTCCNGLRSTGGAITFADVIVRPDRFDAFKVTTTLIEEDEVDSDDIDDIEDDDSED